MLTITEPAAPVMDRLVTHVQGILTLKQYPNGTCMIGGGWQGVGSLGNGRKELDHESLIHNLRVAADVVPGLGRLAIVRSWAGFEGVDPGCAAPLRSPARPGSRLHHRVLPRRLHAGADLRAPHGGAGRDGRDLDDRGAIRSRAVRRMSAARGERRVPGIERGIAFELLLDGEPVLAYPGETIAAALLASGRRALRRTALRHDPRGVYCAMGVCGECAMVVNGQPGVRTCVTRGRFPRMTVSRARAPHEDDRTGDRRRWTRRTRRGRGGRAPRRLGRLARRQPAARRPVLSPGPGHARPGAAGGGRAGEGARAPTSQRARELFSVTAHPRVAFLAGAVVWGVPAAEHAGLHPWGSGRPAARGHHHRRGRRHRSRRPLSRLDLARRDHGRRGPEPSQEPGRLARASRASSPAPALSSSSSLIPCGGRGPWSSKSSRRPRGGAWMALPRLAAVPALLRRGLAYRAGLARAGIPLRWGRTVIEARGGDEVSEAVVAPIDRRGALTGRGRG